MKVRMLVWLLMVLICAGCSGDKPFGPADNNSAELWLAQNNSSNAKIVPPDALTYGKSYAEWSVLWWQWVASAPFLLNENPILDETGALISYEQSDHVWFLAPNIGGVTVRTGTVPSGTMLFFTLWSSEASTREDNGTTLEELRASAAAAADLFVVTSLEIDGCAIPIGPEFRVQSPGMFSLTVPRENIFDFWGVPTPAGTYYPSVSDGYCIMIGNLAVGTHTIHYVGGIPLFGNGQDVTFNLTVVGS